MKSEININKMHGRTIVPLTKKIMDDSYYQLDYQEKEAVTDYKVNFGQSKNHHEPFQFRILFYLRITRDKKDDVVKYLIRSLEYIYTMEAMLGVQVVSEIYLEKWAYDFIKNDVQKLQEKFGGQKKLFRVWPFTVDIQNLSIDANKLLQQQINMVFLFGGDGTLLSLLRVLYKYYSKVEIPMIAAFNMVSFPNFLV
jgi:hypothetical protein